MQQQASLRMTHQRAVILEELRSVTSHPTADELYALVKKRLPRISLAMCTGTWRPWRAQAW